MDYWWYEEIAEGEWQWLFDVGAVALLVDFFIRFVESFLKKKMCVA